ncbi:MAG TPA: hypothetical protein VJB94_00310 [Candidatus Nanoarchaeia archaeon]|nr:hypothetical protein [Candidatus Nanoarchaeia archaeon]
MKVKVKDLQVGNTVLIEGKEHKITRFEMSNIGKQGSSKCRIEATEKSSGANKIYIKLSEEDIEIL